MLMDDHKKIMGKKQFTTEPGTIYRIFEINESYARNESGELPVYVKRKKNLKRKYVYLKLYSVTFLFFFYV